MGWVTALLVYGVIWWLVFFMALPVGVKSQEESDEPTVPGTHASAPEQPNLWKKAAATTVIAALLWGVVYLAVTQEWIALAA